jgi:pyridoxine kinase
MPFYAIEPKPPYVIAISSYAVHGVASLKIFIKVLGSNILPVPSLVLSGLTNIEGVKKFDLPFAELLENTLELAVLRKQRLIFYVGYLGHPEQAEIVINAIKKYREYIRVVITDPVCGDNGRTYVAEDIIAKWPDIIALSDLASPNFTELKLITGYPADAEGAPQIYIQKFKELYPNTGLIISSYPAGNHETGVQLHLDSSLFEYRLPVLAQNFGGSGDLLLSLFIRNRFFHNASVEEALRSATIQTYRTIKFSMDNKCDELQLNEQIFNDTIH